MKDELKRKARPPALRPSSTDAPRTSSRQLYNGEFDFISRIRQHAEGARPSKKDKLAHGKKDGLVHGIGDDAAVLNGRNGRDTVITADLLIEDIDFRRASLPHDIGYKALAVSLSDIAAMGARPRWTLLSLGLPQDILNSPFARDIYEGFLSAAHEFEVTLIGGDVSRTPERVVIDSIVIGETRRGRAVLRAGARTGDHIYVTGTLGGAAAGLRLLEHARHLRAAARTRLLSGFDELTRRQTRPTPRVACGALLGERRLASAMIDLSDGLSSDLAHLCERSGVGALIEASRLPLAPLLRRGGAATEPDRFARALKDDALGLALHGGEDFELLFTVRPRVAARLPKRLGGVRLTRIGEVTEASEGIRISRDGRTQTLQPSGFDHFKQVR